MVATGNSYKYPTMTEVAKEFKRISDTALPITAMSLLSYLKNMVLVVCMGRLGSLELAGGALAIGFTNITGYSVLFGLAMVMESICSQAFGSKNFSIASLTLKRTIIMLLLVSIPISFLWANLEPVMLCLGQNPEITKVASLYCKFAIPDLIANSLLHPLRIYLRSKGTTWPLMWCSLASILLHIPITIVLSFTFRYGVPGIAISTFITNFNTLVFISCYMYCKRAPEDLLRAPLLISSTEKMSSSGEEWKALIKLAIPSCLGVCLEWWWYEFMTLLTGYLQNPQAALATSAIVIQTTSLLYTIPMALSASVSTRVGYELGARRPKRARLSTNVGVSLSLLSSMFGLLWTIIGREAWGRVFTNDSEVLELTMRVLPIIGVCELANCPQTTSCGVLRGSARPSIGAVINFYSFYLVGAPLAIGLAFFWRLGFVGLCYGLLGAQISCVVSILIVVYNTDWEKESLKAEDLVGNKGKFCLREYQAVKCEEGLQEKELIIDCDHRK